jgi:hypothetical protein
VVYGANRKAFGRDPNVLKPGLRISIPALPKLQRRARGASQS